jgi:hypothetical protein
LQGISEMNLENNKLRNLITETENGFSEMSKYRDKKIEIMILIQK